MDEELALSTAEMKVQKNQNKIGQKEVGGLDEVPTLSKVKVDGQKGQKKKQPK